MKELNHQLCWCGSSRLGCSGVGNMMDIVRRALPPGKLLEKGKEEVLMKDRQKLSYVKWACKYHIVFVTKYRKRRIYEEIYKKIGQTIRQLYDQKLVFLYDGYAMLDHIHIW